MDIHIRSIGTTCCTIQLKSTVRQPSIELSEQTAQTRQWCLTIETRYEAIRKAVQRVNYCDCTNVDGFVLEIRNLVEDFGVEYEEAILRHSKTRIQDFSQYSNQTFEDVDELEKALRARYIKIKTLNTVETELARFRMKPNESVTGYSKRAKKLRDERWWL